MKTENHKTKMRPVQRDSKMSNHAEPVKTTPAQRDSGISILKTSPYRPLAPLCGDPYCPLAFKTRPVQRDSKMYIFQFFWDWRHFKNSFLRHIIYCTFKIQQGF
jgi:hypothetical protein